jgi:hypothetical protein
LVIRLVSFAFTVPNDLVERRAKAEALNSLGRRVAFSAGLGLTGLLLDVCRSKALSGNCVNAIGYVVEKHLSASISPGHDCVIHRLDVDASKAGIGVAVYILIENGVIDALLIRFESCVAGLNLPSTAVTRDQIIHVEANVVCVVAVCGERQGSGWFTAIVARDIGARRIKTDGEVVPPNFCSA